jgi:hypothetical protein
VDPHVFEVRPELRQGPPGSDLIVALNVVEKICQGPALLSGAYEPTKAQPVCADLPMALP